ncbi:class I mannose-6-phosphate isomerase [Microbacterium sp. ZW T5_45]|uniref:class I mannose-6-phosphate isomerase n=1 Tax=Microbacterium sp. ZW T5_45 TaxID=3378080 RepID=UPI003854BB5B
MTILLPRNSPHDRFYRGGARLTAMRGGDASATHEPEDWIGSTTTVRGEATDGLSVLPDGRLLRDAVEADPVGWLGAEHVARWGADVRLLVKLLDAGQRLPVHAHPHDRFAAEHLGCAHGKAEAWYILEGGTVHIGLREDADPAHLAELVRTQDTAALLALLHQVEVSPGDVVWMPPGELHAIGEGVLLLELQQPEDLSILLEWEGFAIDGAVEGHLGLGFDLALTAVATGRREVAELLSTAPRSGSVLPAAADEYFVLERLPLSGPASIDAGFSVITVVNGHAEIAGRPLTAGDVLLVPAEAGVLEADGDGEVLVARPPRP